MASGDISSSTMDGYNLNTVWPLQAIALGILGVFWFQTFWNFNDDDDANPGNLVGTTTAAAVAAAPGNVRQSILASEFWSNVGMSTLFFLLAQLLEIPARRSLERMERKMREEMKALSDALTLEREEGVQWICVTLDPRRRLREMEEDLEERTTWRRQEEEKENDEQFPPHCKHEKDRQALLGRIRQLEDDNERLKGDARAKDLAKDQLEDQILKTKEDYAELTDRATELTETHDALKATAMSLNVQLTKITCQLQQQENLALQLQEEKGLLALEKKQLEGRNREKSDVINRFRIEEGELNKQIHDLEESVRQLEGEIGVLKCDLEEKEFLLNRREEQYRENEGKLGEMSKRYLDMEAEKDRLELEVQKQKYDCERLRKELDGMTDDMDNLERWIDSLEHHLLIAIKWRDEVGAGLMRTAQKLGIESCF